MTTTDIILIAQAIASAAMCGLIWFVQVVHYPLFARIDTAHAAGYPDENQRRTGLVVIPPMLVEGATAALLAINPPPGITRATALIGLLLVILVWLSTAVVQMPLHARLHEVGHQPQLVTALVRTNWFRTVLWTARALLAAWMLRVAD